MEELESVYNKSQSGGVTKEKKNKNTNKTKADAADAAAAGSNERQRLPDSAENTLKEIILM